MIKKIQLFLLFIITISAQTVIDVDLYHIAEDMVNGPEAIAFNDEGKMYTANEDGRIIVLSRDVQIHMILLKQEVDHLV